MRLLPPLTRGPLFLHRLVVLASVFFVLLSPTPGPAEIYQWTDENGTLQFTDDLSKVPPSIRKQVEEDAKKPSDPTDYNIILIPGGSSIPSTDSESSMEEQSEGSTDPKQNKEYWQSRIANVKEKIQKSEERLRQIQVEQRQVFTTNQGPGMQQKAAALAEEKERLQQRIEALNRELTETIPEQARQEGAPPR